MFVKDGAVKDHPLVIRDPETLEIVFAAKIDGTYEGSFSNAVNKLPGDSPYKTAFTALLRIPEENR